jgi:hypothetical protein
MLRIRSTTILALALLLIAPQFASGGFIADPNLPFVINGSQQQQQWLTRNSEIAGWSNGVSNQVFAGVEVGRHALPTFEVTITPNYLHRHDDPAKNYQAVWLIGKSPTTPYRSPDSQRHVQRYLLLDPRFRDAEGRRGRDKWWFVIERLWPSSYDSRNHGKWGTQVNFHNVAGDAGPPNSGGVGWGFGRGISALYLGWKPELRHPTVNIELHPSTTNMALPVPKRDAWNTYVIRWVAGRTDGTTVRPGSITVWANGAERPVIRRTNINTVHRARGPDGKHYTQRWMQLWEGDYTSALPVRATTRLVLTRIGKTLGEALADRPSLAGTNLRGWYYSGRGVNLGPPSARRLPSRRASAARIPPSLLRAATSR